jgi:phage shock protein A
MSQRIRIADRLKSQSAEQLERIERKIDRMEERIDTLTEKIHR